MNSVKPEPSISMIRRMASNAPETLVNEIIRLRQERDALRRTALSNMADHLRAVTIGQRDIIVIRGMGVPPDAAQALCADLKRVIGWDGMVVVMGDGRDIESLPDDRAMDVYTKLRARFGGIG